MSLDTRAKKYAMVIKLLFANRQLSGKLSQVNRGSRHLSFGVRLSDPMRLDSALRLAEPMALSCGVNNVLSQRIEGLINYQIELPEMYWLFYTRADLPANSDKAVGLAEQKRPINFDFEYPHSLIAGSTGSGKSVALKSILISLMTTYSPDEMNSILIDPHRELDDFNNESHLIMPIATSANDIQNALAYANQELTKRKEENIKDGQILVIAIDEAASDEVLQNNSNLAVLKNISKQARKYKIHLILGTQKPSHSELPAILDNLLNKWIGKLSDANLSARVTGHAGLMCHKLTGKGDFIHVNGSVDRLQIARATDADFNKLERGSVNQTIPICDNNIIELPPSTDGPGRPPIELDAKTLAAYFHFGPNNITEKTARDVLDLRRTGHVLHRDFCLEFAKEYMRLRRVS